MIALYVHALAATGVVRNVRLLAADLSARGYSVRIVTALPGGEGVAGVPHHALLRHALPSRPLEKIVAAWRLGTWLRRMRPDLLISAGNHGHSTAWAGSRGVAGLKRVYRISNDIMRTMPGAPASDAAAWTRRAAAAVVARDAAHLVLVSPTLIETPAFARAASEGRVTVIPNGIDPAVVRARAVGPPPHPWLAPGGAPVVLAIGRLSPQKNFGTLLQAFALLRARRPVRLIILGESRDRARDRLRAQADALGLADDLAMPGVVTNVFPWLAHADAFVLPSWWEGSPNVLLEAMAVNVPCVASRSAGNAAQLLGEGRHGLLADPADPQALADALERQLDPATAVRPGNRIEAFSQQRVSQAWADLIGRLYGEEAASSAAQ